MKQETIEIVMDVCSFDELTPEEQELVVCARTATRNSYAPYSRFHVGAAARLGDGSVAIGANQENAAFPSGLCAERTAVFAAQANHPDQPITTLAIAAADAHGLRHKPVTPCGACRQVVLEVEDRYKTNVEILLAGLDGIYRLKSIKDLLPLSFVDSDMR